MENDKNLTPEIQEAQENFDIAEAVKHNKNDKKSKRSKKLKKLKNQALLTRGSYSVVIVAVVIAAVIILNVLLNSLSKVVNLEFDMSSEKNNSMTQENIDYIKDVEDEINIIVCADEEGYTGEYMAYFAQQYGITDDASDYYSQTVKLVKKYEDYNKKIDVKFMDTQSSEFSAVTSKYSTDSINYGDIIVSCEKDGNERYKVLGFNDIYEIYEDTTYASYGYSVSSITGNKVETAITSAIEYVTSGQTKKIGFFTGHTAQDYTASYQQMLKTNNYEIEVVSDSIITSVSDEFDAIVIAAPSSDFIGSELDAISEFLDNDGKLGKGLIFIADVYAPYLTNLYDFLEQWGISVDEGILFETNSSNHMPDDPFTMGTYSAGNDDITNKVNICITGSNVPVTAVFEEEDNITVTSLVETPATVVAAPIGTAADWNGASDYEKKSYSGVIQSAKSGYDEDNNTVSSHVYVFSSVDYIYSEYSEQTSVSNKDITLAAAERAAGAEETGISFISKTITNESFVDSVNDTSANAVTAIFVFALPIACIVAGIYIYIKRRNA